MRLRDHWTLDSDVTFLNHGSFGACPRVVLEAQAAWRAQMERQPVRFFTSELESLLDEARESLAAFLGAVPARLAFVENATAAVNAVFRSAELAAGDEILVLDQGYNACVNVAEFVAARSGARVVRAALPFPATDEQGVIEAVLAAVTDRTRFALVDHIASPTGFVLPIAELVRELEARDVAVLVDGAHAAGQVELDLEALGASFYTGNCHKWLFAPKGAAFLVVRADREAEVRPAVISHGANAERTDRSRFLLEFDWMGTRDPTALLSIPAGIAFGESLLPGGWPALRQRNHALALEGRQILCEALEVEPLCPRTMVGCLAGIPLPDEDKRQPLSPSLHDRLGEQYGIEVPIVPWPRGGRLVRISAQAYNQRADYVHLAEALLACLPAT